MLGMVLHYARNALLHLLIHTFVRSRIVLDLLHLLRHLLNRLDLLDALSCHRLDVLIELFDSLLAICLLLGLIHTRLK